MSHKGKGRVGIQGTNPTSSLQVNVTGMLIGMEQYKESKGKNSSLEVLHVF